MSESLVMIASFGSYPEAERARRRLESQGIPAVVQDDTDPVSRTGEALLQVSQRELQRALEALANPADDAIDALLYDLSPAEETAVPPPVRCPVCGSEFVSRQRPGAFGSIFRALLAQLVQLPGSGGRGRYTCRVCTSRWREGEDTEIPKLG